MMHQPFIGEWFSGDGASARYRGPAGDRKLKARTCASVKDAMLYTTSPLLMNDEERAQFRKVEAQAKHSRYGGDCYSYCMVAAGHIDLVIESGVNAFDIVALIPIIEGAGGVVTTWTGEPASNGGRIIAAGDRRAHAEAMKLLAS
jgi:myo-inositol-1(or 4)-monophosphatase